MSIDRNNHFQQKQKEYTSQYMETVIWSDFKRVPYGSREQRKKTMHKINISTLKILKREQMK